MRKLKTDQTVKGKKIFHTIHQKALPSFIRVTQVPLPPRHGISNSYYSQFFVSAQIRVVGFFYEDEYVGDKPDERLKNSPVTARPFSKTQPGQQDDSG